MVRIIVRGTVEAAAVLVFLAFMGTVAGAFGGFA